MLPKGVMDVMHKAAVGGLILTTVYVGGFIPVRFSDIHRKGKELEQYAKENNLSLEEAAAQLCQNVPKMASNSMGRRSFETKLKSSLGAATRAVL